MQPPSEHVHWLFATGFLLLALCLLAEAVVGTDVWRRRAWRAYLWPGLAFALGVLMWPVMTFYTNSAIHMIAHGAWAQVLMGGAAMELGLVSGKLRSGWWRLGMPAGFLVSGTAFLVHEQNSVALPALGVHAPRARLDARRGLDLPARPGLQATLAACGDRLCAHLRRRGRDALLRSRRRADLRTHLAPCGSAASMRRLLFIGVLALLVFPSEAFAHATLLRTTPQFRQRLSASPPTVVLRFDQYVKVLPQSVQLFSATHPLHVKRIWADGLSVKAALPRLPRGPYTIRWHALSGDGHVVSGVFTFGVRANAPPPTEAFGSSGPTRSEDVVRWLYFVALALVVGGLGFRLLVLRGRALTPRAERRFFILTGIGVIATLDAGIVAFLMRAEDALQLPFGRLLYGDLSPLARSRFGHAFIAMTLGFALVAALLFLSWLTDRAFLLWPAFLLALLFASGLSLSGHSAADAGSSWKSQLADWAHLSAACLWIGGLIQLVAVVWPLMPDCAARGLPRLFAACNRLRRRPPGRGDLPGDPAPAAAEGSLDDQLRRGAPRQDRARVARARVGRRAQARGRARTGGWQGGKNAAAPARELARREHGRHGRAARRRRARGREAAGSPGAHATGGE